jgi:hypothetical protein
MPALSYWIDHAGTILRVEGPWDGWMTGDEEVPAASRADRVVGAPLYSFIDGLGVQAAFQALHDRVRKTGLPIEFPSRCDSPSLLRRIQIRISLDGDLVRYDSAVTAEIRRPRPLPWPVPDAEILVAMCSSCKSYRFPRASQKWKEIDCLFAEPDLPDRFSITHGICPACAELWYPGL